MNYLAYGGGTNSTALAIECVKRGIPIDLIAFADTGAERPETYWYVRTFSRWMTEHGQHQIITVTEPGDTLEADCLRRKALPSVAYGNKFRGCSDRWKQRPQARLLEEHPMAQALWQGHGKVTKLIGFDADEPWRCSKFEDEKTRNRYPLVEWGMGREECIETIRAAGLPLPGKSSCFFCPNMTEPEIKELYYNERPLFDRALAMESNADLKAAVIRGLDRELAWSDYQRFFEQQTEMPFVNRPPKRQCGSCYDGGAS